MIKVVCINNTRYEGILELYKIYDAEEKYFDPERYYYHVYYLGYYPRHLFMTLAEYRDKQIDNILNE